MQSVYPPARIRCRGGGRQIHDLIVVARGRQAEIGSRAIQDVKLVVVVDGFQTRSRRDTQRRRERPRITHQCRRIDAAGVGNQVVVAVVELGIPQAVDVEARSRGECHGGDVEPHLSRSQGAGTVAEQRPMKQINAPEPGVQIREFGGRQRVLVRGVTGGGRERPPISHPGVLPDYVAAARFNATPEIDHR